MRFLAVILLSSLLLSAAEASQPEVLERLIVIDISASMKGEPLEEVRAELTKLLQAQPASAVAPVTFLTFSDDPHPIQQFTKQKQAIRFVESLRSDRGGTRIGAALEAAIDRLRNKSSIHHVTLMLYTDDQDPDRAAIERAEQSLDMLFDDRTERGLSQAVYIRSWSSGGTLGALAVELARNPNVTVMDSSTPLTVVPVTIRPEIEAIHAELHQDGVHLDVELRAACEVKGVPKGFTVPPLVFRCLNDPLGPTGQWEIIPGDRPKSLSLRIKPSEQEIAAEKLELRFRVSPADKGAPSGDQRLIPLLQRSELVVPVSFSSERTFEFAAEFASSSDGQWDPSDIHRAIYRLDLTVGVRPVGNFGAKSPIQLQLRAAEGCQLVGGPETVTLADKRAQTVSLEIAVPVPDDVIRTGQGDIRASIEVIPAKDHPRIKFPKPVVRVTSAPLSPPPATVAQIDVSIHSVSPVIWYAPPDIGVFRASLDVTVNGPLPGGAEILVSGSPEVRQLRLTPTTIHSGLQTVWMDVAARLKPSPESTELVFGLQPPPSTPLVRTTCPQQLQLMVAGPPPVRLVVQGRRGIWGGTVVWAPTTAHFAEIPLRIRLEGPVARPFVEQLQIEVGQDAQPLKSPQLLTPSRWETVGVRLSDQQDASYFWDRVDVVRLELAASRPGPAVLPTSHECRVVRQAPFKRQLFVVLSALAILAVPCLLVSLARRLRPGATQEKSFFSVQAYAAHESEEQRKWTM